MNMLPDDLPRTLPPGIRPFASKIRPDQSGDRDLAREKNNFVGWFELERTGPSYPYRRIRGVWTFDESLFRFPGGRRQAFEAGDRSAFTEASGDLVTAEAPRGHAPHPSECSGPGFSGATD